MKIYKFILIVFLFVFNYNISFADDDFFEDDFDIDYNPTLSQNNNNTFKVWDPFEKYNRAIFSFNIWCLKNIVSPLYNNVYINITTDGMRTSVSNFHTNITLPLTFVNYILQLNIKDAVSALYSFILNTTIGIFGFYNPARYQQTLPESTSFAMTLAKYYIPAGPYLMFPFLGPTDLRGILSDTGEVLFSPLSYNLLEIGGKRDLIFTTDTISYSRYTLSVLYFSEIATKMYNELLVNSFDPYALTKSAYEQMQSYKINKMRNKK